MSDLRFARELGAEFERLERSGKPEVGRRRFRSSTAKLPAAIATVVGVAAPVAVAALAIVLLSHSTETGRHPAPSAGLALSGGNCRTPARTAPLPGNRRASSASDGMIRAACGRVSGIAWQLRVKPGTELPGAIAHGRLRLAGHDYGLCSQPSLPVPFGLINTGPHGIVYGYVANGAGSYRITISADGTPLATGITDSFFFIRALPRAACSYRSLSVKAVSTPVRSLPPDINRSLNVDATQFTTTMSFGTCRRQALVTAGSEGGQTQGRAPNAPLAQVTGQLRLVAPPGTRSRASGTVWELAHDGQRGINLLAVRLTPGRYGIWLRGPRGRISAVAAATVKHGQLRGAYDLPADASAARQILITVQSTGHIEIPGRIVLRAMLP